MEGKKVKKKNSSIFTLFPSPVVLLLNVLLIALWFCRWCVRETKGDRNIIFIHSREKEEDIIEVREDNGVELLCWKMTWFWEMKG